MSRLSHSGLAAGAATLWIAGAGMRSRLYDLGVLRRNRLRAPVISVGNLSWGGTGKTPFTIWLAQQLQAEGLRVSVLTRGYGRLSREAMKVLPPGTTPESSRADGDEVQLYLRRLQVPIGISNSRYQAGRAVEAEYSVDLHLLDDGFQHLRLERDLDLVLVDASNPWGARPGWPLLLREGFSSLRRAHAVLLTRCEHAMQHPSIEELKAGLNSFHPGIPCYEVSTRLAGFRESAEHGPAPDAVAVEQLEGRQVMAFCALEIGRAHV